MFNHVEDEEFLDTGGSTLPLRIPGWLKRFESACGAAALVGFVAGKEKS